MKERIWPTIKVLLLFDTTFSIITLQAALMLYLEKNIKSSSELRVRTYIYFFYSVDLKKFCFQVSRLY